jgi:hypothetical protein
VSVAPFDPLLALRTLNDHGVRYVVIGGLAGRLHGSPTVTNDLDVCYDRDPANLGRLASALRALHAQLRGGPAGLPFVIDERTLEGGANFTLATEAGNLDVIARPAGVRSFDELERAADVVDLEGIEVSVASVDDLIRMKQAAARPKDLIEAEVLGALREEIESSGDG